MFRLLQKFRPLLIGLVPRVRFPAEDHSRLLAPTEFRRRLMQERMRCDRVGGTLALLVATPGSDRLAYRELERVLDQRLRETDIAGRLDDRRLAALLPETPLAGAWTVAEDLRRRLSRDLDVAFEVYCYPGAQPARRRRGSLAPAGSPTDSSEVSLPLDTDAHPLEPVLATPLPAWKRITDVVLASLGLVILSPALLAIGVAVRWTSPGPALFRQLRTGWAGRPFVLYKFRTMCVEAEELKAALLERNEQDGPAFKIEDDPRVTPLGGFLRRTCIDELPQLWNVLRGEMTLVGPRPLPCDEAAQCRGWQRRRLDVTPGLTCFWQVGGSRHDFADWMRLDLRYVRQRGFLVDARLLWRTFVKVVFRRASC